MGWLVFAVVLVTACGPNKPAPGGDDGGDDGPAIDAPDVDGTTSCPAHCSEDLHTVFDCQDRVVATCTGTDACNETTGTCTNACAAADLNKRSIGCDYYATDMDVAIPSVDACFAMYVANTWNAPAHLTVERGGVSLGVAAFTRIPSGQGASLTYGPYDAVAGLVPGQVAVLFLAGDGADTPTCPVAPAVALGGIRGTGLSSAFHVTSDVPVVAYQINPFGGGSAAITGASLLLPSSVWDTEYVAVNTSAAGPSGVPSLDIIAREADTTVTIRPTAAITAGGGVPGTAAGQPVSFTLQRGQVAQISQTAELTGSVVTSTKPIGFMAGHTCMTMPLDKAFCDHGEQMIPPVHALGNRHVSAMYRARVPAETTTLWRVIGAVDGTQLTWSANVGGPTTLQKGQAVAFSTGTPFAVESQDPLHPFLLFTYMRSSTDVMANYGDPDFVIGVPPAQYLKSYVFFADPTYPETDLVLVRARGEDGAFHDVDLDCAGVVGGWEAITADYQFARPGLSTGFANVGACSTGRHEIKSDAPFGMWVWGWGRPGTTPASANVSYGYPGGMNVKPINAVVIQ